ncbi:probable galacturonosyltransferase 4 isoform X2 [Juglans microcarpa x Juglans regia]|uniref:probable galacturonosyltransferase 4 isoform X2 n=1 Tax=Juglans microcarpa x Juglans regia TaxID=2249226 RepID=UPI001B7E4013|nr:probable galacturonosyltransferase 4 isoform X2 [Juglans microcarpa x Juglans regia]
MRVRNLVVVLLFVTVIAPVVLYTDRLATFKTSSSTDEFNEDVTTIALNGHNQRLNVLPQESSTTLKEPIGIVYSENSTKSLQNSGSSAQQRSTNIALSTQDLHLESGDHKSTRVLSATSVEENQHHDQSQKNPIREVNDATNEEKEIGEDTIDADDKADQLSEKHADQLSDNASQNMETKREQQSTETPSKIDKKVRIKIDAGKQKDQTAMPDARVRQLKDQLIRAKVYLSLPATRNNPHFTRELRGRIKEIQRALGDASKDSELARNAYEKLKAMEQTLAKGKQINDDCAAIAKKLRAMIHSSEEQLRVHKKQTLFLTQLTAKTLPKGLHCLPLRLTTEYYTLSSSRQHFPNQEKLEDTHLYHYALFSDNVLAAAVVVNSTVTHAKDPSKHVFHVVTDRLNYAAMRMWFLVNPPGKATVQVQNIEEFTWLNSSYSPVLKQLGSPSMIDYYFRAHRANSDVNLKYRNPKYLSILNHIRFYLPEIFPKLNKVLFLDDDVVVQKDLTALWSLDLKGNVNGAVETCGESFHRFDRYLNFSNPLISKNFDPHACGWAYGMNVFDLEEWKRQNITGVYHSWQKLNHDRQLWKLGTLPPGLITFWKRTYPLHRHWHVLGLGYNPSVSQKEIERAAVIHYNGNLKPWLEISIPKYRNYWTRYIDYDHIYLRECNINP